MIEKYTCQWIGKNIRIHSHWYNFFIDSNPEVCETLCTTVTCLNKIQHHIISYIKYSHGISKITTAMLLKTRLYLLGHFCFPPTYLKILFIHSEERVWTHCLYVKPSGHIGATNSSIDAFSCHPHLWFMTQLKKVHQIPFWPLQKYAPCPNYPPCQLSGASHTELSATNILRLDPPPGSSDNREALSQDHWKRSSARDLFESPQSS